MGRIGEGNDDDDDAIYKIKKENPIEDFKKMMDYKKEDLTEIAVE